jgi:DNA-directed RNA polymerase subunit RPC12/RpoP
MYKCQTCGKDFGTTKTTNWKYCPSCLGKLGGKARTRIGWPEIIKDKYARLHPAGYLYYTITMCTPEEISLLPDSGRTILVHRLIMAKHLGKPIFPNQVVMHIDGNKLNNDIANLQLGDADTNSQQHWEARQDAAFWRNMAVNIFLALS